MADSQKYKPLLHDNPLCGISTYKDTLNLATGACTRAIKKLVLTGNENYGTSGGNTWLMIGNDTLDFRGTANGVYCSHVPTVLRTDLATNTCCWGGGQIGDLIININDYSGESLKAYIADLYAAGTPLTVWYVLATATTETITVPSGLSGTEEGYLTQSGTPTPTNPIYPTANEVLIWEHSLRKLTTATDTLTTLPADIYADGNNATVGLVGNMEQTGTPTPSSPIQPSECGERTENLFDLTDYSSYTTGISDIVITSNSITYTAASAFLAIIYLFPLDTTDIFTIQLGSESSEVRLELRYRKNGSTVGDVIIVAIGNSYVIRGSENIDEIQINISNGVSTGTCKASNIMLNLGSTPLPYEPYGYKIPILSASTTTPVYLGEVQSTRIISKYEFTGEEDFGRTSAGYFYAQNAFTNYNSSLYGVVTTVFSHYKAVANNVNGNKLLNNEACLYSYYQTPTQYKEVYINDTRFTTADEFNSYLAQQYAAGTPVTVWYVLATPQTAVVNEPIRKIGDYADSVSGITIPTITGANSFDVLTTLKPSEVSLAYTGWHDASVKEWDGSEWQ